MSERLDYLVNIIHLPLTECSRQRRGEGECSKCETWVREVLREVLAAEFAVSFPGNRMDAPHGPICKCGKPSTLECGSCGSCG